MGAEILLKTDTVDYIQCKCHSAQEKIQIHFILANSLEKINQMDPDWISKSEK